MSMQSHHLSDEQFADVLAGDTSSVAVFAHLAACDLCRAEVDAVRSSLRSFQEQGTSWAGVCAPARVPVPSVWQLRLTSFPSWRTGLTALVTAALLAVGLGVTPSHVRDASSTAAQGSKQPSNAEVAADNRLMLSIDQELRYSADGSAQGSPREPGYSPRSSSQVETVAN